MSTPTTRRGLRERAGASGAPAMAPAPAVPRRRGGIGRMLGDLGLWIAAAAGVVCIVLVILAMTAQITLIMFRTGSMSPTIPAGSVAVVQRVDAAQVEVGDVVTVDREDELPVTHRVTSVEPGASESERIITMRGDANATDDPFPYTVTSVRTVLFSIPGIASVIVGMGDPWVLGGLTAGATVLVIWAFWPRSGSAATRKEQGLT
ncbi:signal peptidase I [Microbacterium sp. 22179]|uniref:signal peptidase I n=1 Tax=Microbacterium sp. 22179 TaxID=3453886 RepID=UPI003F8625B3